MLQQVVHRLEQLHLRLAQAEHEAALGGAFCPRFGGQFFGAFEHMQAAVVLGAAAHQRCQALHGFQVVVEDVRARFHDRLKGVVLAIEIRHKDFDGDAGNLGAHGLDGAGKVVRAAVRHVIASHGGDDDVVQAEALRGLGHALRLVRFEGEGLRRLHRAKTAGAGAAVARDHEGGRALAPAFPAVRALGLLAHGVQFEVGDERLGAPENRIARQLHANPVRLLFLVQGGVYFDGHVTGL